MEMTSRERVACVLAGGLPDRVPHHEHFWPEAVERWHQEGLPADMGAEQYFDNEFNNIGIDLSLRLPGRIVEETEEYVIHWDSNGVKRKDFKGKSGFTPHWLEHTIKEPADWFEYKERLTPCVERLPGNLTELGKALDASNKFVCFSGVEPYESAWPVLGQVGIFTWMMEYPEVVRDIFETYADLVISTFDLYLEQGGYCDGAWFWGDVGYRNSLLFSPALYRDLLKPAHARIVDHFKHKNLPCVLHSCGKVLEIIPDIIEEGWAALQPLEAKVGQDIRELRKEYGDVITFFGNIDVRILSLDDKAAIEEEISSKIRIAGKNGRYIFHSDHSVPQTVSFENYKFALEMAEKYGTYNGKPLE